MRGKMWFLGGVAVGFVVGARAGRERYEQLMAATRRMMDHPTVQEAAGVVQEQSKRLVTEGKDTVSKKLSHTKVGERLGKHGSESDTGAEPLAGATRAGTAGNARGSTGTSSTSTTT